MASNHRDRRDRERDRDREEFPRKQPHKETVRSEPPLGEYFLDGDGIDRQVLQSCICRFLGPEATCKPYEHEGRAGYKIRAVRAFTPEMLHDLRERSREYVSENTVRKMGNRDGKSSSGKAESPGSNTGAEVPYEASQTRTRKDAPPDMDMDIDYQPPRSRGPLSPPGPAMGYTAPYMPDPPMPYGYSAAYSQSYPYPGIPTSVGPSAGFPPRGYGNDPGYGYPTSRDGPLGPSQMPYGYPIAQGGYGGEPTRMGADGYVFPSEPPRALDHVRDARDLRDPRDTRDPRDIRDMRDPRDLRDPRAIRDPRDPRDTRDPRYGMHDPMSGIQSGPPQHRDVRDPRTSGQYDQPPRDPYNRPPQRR